jgi:hypothetical protein
MKILLAHTYKNGKKVIKDVKKYYKSISKKANDKNGNTFQNK